MKFPAFKYALFLVLGLITASTLFMPRPAAATITITPMYVLIEGRARYADLNLINTSDTEQTYDIGWRFFKMDEGTGEYLIMNKPTTDYDITQNVVFTPKRVTLAARETQKVRLALRLKGDPPPPGDYRAHLEFKQARDEAPAPAPMAATPSSETTGNGEKHAVKVGVTVGVGYSVPVIYRVGDGDATATMGEITTNINPNSGAVQVMVPITRQGTTSLMGDLSIYHTPKGSSRTLVGSVKNANIFSEAVTRTFEVPLTMKSLTDGTLDIILRDGDMRKNVTYAERSLAISQ